MCASHHGISHGEQLIQTLATFETLRASDSPVGECDSPGLKNSKNVGCVNVASFARWQLSDHVRALNELRKADEIQTEFATRSNDNPPVFDAWSKRAPIAPMFNIWASQSALTRRICTIDGTIPAANLAQYTRRALTHLHRLAESRRYCYRYVRTRYTKALPRAELRTGERNQECHVANFR